MIKTELKAAFKAVDWRPSLFMLAYTTVVSLVGRASREFQSTPAVVALFLVSLATLWGFTWVLAGWLRPAEAKAGDES